jgi:hypothetical protein
MKLKISFFSAPLFAVLIAFSLSSKAHSTELVMTVYKTPTCGCCQKWVDHMSDNNLQSTVVDLADLSSIKARYAIAGRYRSCHTGVVVTESGDYVFEGHVPVSAWNAIGKPWYGSRGPQRLLPSFIAQDRWF